MSIFTLTPSEKITKAKTILTVNYPFFSVLASHMKVKEGGTETLAVDAKSNLYYNPDFVDKLSVEEVVGVVAHEALHLALQHPNRGKGRNLYVGDVSLWNIAIDIVVNNIIVKNSYSKMRLPRGGIIPQNDSISIFGVKIEDISKKSAEEIYNELVEALKNEYGEPQVYTIYGEGQGDGQGEGGGQEEEGEKGEEKGEGQGEGDEQGEGGEEREKKGDGQGENEEEEQRKGQGQRVKGWKDVQGERGFDEHRWKKGSKETEKSAEEWRKILSIATNYAKQRGKMPAGIEREYEILSKGKIQWRAIIRNLMKKEIPADFTWSRPNRKLISQGIYTPAVQREGADVIVLIDTSGSMSQRELSEVITEIINMAKSIQGLNLRVITHDSKVQDDYEVRNGNISKLKKIKMHGGGGTSHIPALQYIRDRYKDTKLIISFTDGFSEFPEKFDIKTVFVLAGEHVSVKSMPSWAYRVIEMEEGA